MPALDLTPKQQLFADEVLSGKYLYPFFGGGIRGGKTVVTLAILFIFCKVYPRSRWAIVRKDLPTLRRNTLPSFERFKPTPFVGKLNQSTWSVKCENGSEIIFFPESIKDDPELYRWRGLEVNGFLLEEANELRRESFLKAVERAGSWIVRDGEQPPPFVLGTCNPGDGYVKDMFYSPSRSGSLEAPYYFLQSLIVDNPHLPKSYLQSLESLKTSSPKTYERFVMGNWEASEDPDQLIKYEWIIAAKNVEPIAGKARIGVDVARFGDDKTVICLIEGNTIKELDAYSGLSTDKVADRARMKMLSNGVDAPNVKVDSVGLGAGVVDSLRAEGFGVTEFISSASQIYKSTSKFKFKNLRCQAWWEFREALRLGEVCIDVEEPKLFEDLTAIKYKVGSDKMLEVESKDSIKKRIGRSTDFGDAVIYAWFKYDSDQALTIDPDRGYSGNRWDV